MPYGKTNLNPCEMTSFDYPFLAGTKGSKEECKGIWRRDGKRVRKILGKEVKKLRKEAERARGSEGNYDRGVQLNPFPGLGHGSEGVKNSIEAACDTGKSRRAVQGRKRRSWS
jgi:hypothetical protein